MFTKNLMKYCYPIAVLSLTIKCAHLIMACSTAMNNCYAWSLFALINIDSHRKPGKYLHYDGRHDTKAATCHCMYCSTFI